MRTLTAVAASAALAVSGAACTMTIPECLEDWQDALRREDYGRYLNYLHSSVRDIPEYASEAAMRFWGEELRSLAEQGGFRGEFRIERVDVDTDEAPAGAFRAYPVLRDGRLLEESLVIVRDGRRCRVLRIFS